MTDADRLRKLRHDLANPLAALLAEAQLLLMTEDATTAEARAAVKEIEQLAIRMRAMLREE